MVSDGARNYSAGVPNVTFSFDSIEAPSVWAQYQSLEEMFAACQIPEEKLKSMSTDELVEVCMSHPLYAIYSAYNNELEGALRTEDAQILKSFVEAGANVTFTRSGMYEMFLRFYNQSHQLVAEFTFEPIVSF